MIGFGSKQPTDRLEVSGSPGTVIYRGGAASGAYLNFFTASFSGILPVTWSSGLDSMEISITNISTYGSPFSPAAFTL